MNTNIGAIQNLLKKSSLNDNLKLVDEQKNDEIIQNISLDLIEFDPNQPRQEIIEDEIFDIVRTLRAPGSKINQPITVWPMNKDGKYLLKMGEKRTRASKIAGRTTIPTIIDTRYDFENAEHRARNYAEQYIENHARGGLQPLDDCLALSNLKAMFGNLKDVMLYVGAKSQGTISDKVKVSEIKTNPKYSFLLEFYNNESLKFKDLTNLRNLLKVFDKNEQHFDLIKSKIINAVEEGAFNRTWVDGLLAYDFNKKDVDVVSPAHEKSKKLKTESKPHKDNERLEYTIRPVKKAKILARVSLDGRKKVNCQLVLDRLDNEEGYVWVLEEGKESPIRVNISKLSLTEIL